MTRASRLWLLRPRPEVLARERHPWAPWFDKAFGMIVRAASELEARALAQSQAGGEGRGIYAALGCEEEEIATDVWLDADHTTCEVLASEGSPGVILVDRREA
jgi:hypothetical protein